MLVDFFDIFFKNISIKNIKNIIIILLVPVFIVSLLLNMLVIAFVIFYLLIWLPIRRIYIPSRIARELYGDNIIEKLYEIEDRGFYNEKPRIYKALNKELNELLYTYIIKDIKTSKEKIEKYNKLQNNDGYKKLSQDEKYKVINYIVYNNKFNKELRNYINDRYTYDETCRVLKDVTIYFNETVSKSELDKLNILI